MKTTINDYMCGYIKSTQNLVDKVFPVLVIFWQGFDGTSLKPSKHTNSIHLLWLWSVSDV